MRKLFLIVFLSFCVLIISYADGNANYIHHDLDNNPLTLNELLNLEDNISFKNFNKGNYFVVPVAHSYLHEDVLFTYYDFVYYIFDSSPAKVQIFDVEKGKRIIFNDVCDVMYCSYYPVTKDYRVNVYPQKKQVGESFVLERTTTTIFYGQEFTKPCYALFFGNFLDIKFDEGIKQGQPNPPSSPQSMVNIKDLILGNLPSLIKFLVFLVGFLISWHVSWKLLRDYSNI